MSATKNKVHIAVDTLGHLLALHVTSASEQDRAQVEQLAEAVQQATGESVELAYVDQGYTGEKPAQAAQQHGMQLEVSSYRKPSAAWCCCPNGGWWNAPSAGRRASGAGRGIMNACRKRWRGCTVSSLLVCFSNALLRH